MKQHFLFFILFILLLSYGESFSKGDDQQKNNSPVQNQIPITDRELISLLARAMQQHIQIHNLTRPQVFTHVEVIIRPVDTDADSDSDTDRSDID